MIQLDNGLLRAAVSPRGAELLALSGGGTEYIWKSDARYWAYSAPILFPYVGRLAQGAARLTAGSTACRCTALRRRASSPWRSSRPSRSP